MTYKKGLTPEEKEERKRQLQEQVQNIVDNFQTSPDNIIEYLKFNSQFHQYSTKNTMLIYEQNSMARFCASYKKFKDMGYQVQKGQKGMKIFFPQITTLWHDAATEQWKKLSEATPEEKADIKAGRYDTKQITSFGIGTVFDIGQTDCPVSDYPKIFDMGFSSQLHNELYNAVVEYAKSKGINVSERFFPSITKRGYYNRAADEIVISDKLEDSMKLSVICHELAHAVMHSSSEAADLPTEQKEVEADSLSLMLRNHLGITDIEDVRQKHLQDNYERYLDFVKSNQELTQNKHYADLSEILDNVNNAYSSMIDDFNKSIQHFLEHSKTHQYEIKADIHSSVYKNYSEFSQTIDDFLNGNINPTDQIFVCQTPEVMKACGADNLDVMIYQDTIKKILSDDFNKFEHPHNLTADSLKQLPVQLQKPIMVFKGSHEGSIVLVTDLNKNNERIIISCQLNCVNKRHEINRITSMYGKENIANYLNTQIEKGNLIGCQKNIANQMLQSVGLYLPSEETFIDYTDIISNLNENVNTLAEKNGFYLIEKNNLFAFGTKNILDNSAIIPVNQIGSIDEIKAELKRWKAEVDFDNPKMLEIENTFINKLVEIQNLENEQHSLPTYELKEIAQWSDDNNYLNFSVVIDDYLFDGTFKINDDINGKGMKIVGINCYSSGQENQVSEIWDRLEKQLQEKANEMQHRDNTVIENSKHIEKSETIQQKDFSQTIDDFLDGKINPYAQIFVCKTTDAMLACGAQDLDVIINQSTLRKIMSNDESKYRHPHNLDKNIIKSIPDELNSPIMILKGSEPSSIVLISNLTDENNHNIIISCKLNSEKSIYEVNEITSVYPKNNIGNYINTQLNKHNLIGCNKKRANRLLKSLGLQSSEVETSIDYTNIISDSDKNVNSEILKDENLLDSSITSQVINNYSANKTSILSLLKSNKELPENILSDQALIKWYSFAAQINDDAATKKALEDVLNNDMQIVAINSAAPNFYSVESLKGKIEIYHTKSEAINAVLSDDSIAKLVDIDTMNKAIIEQDYSYLSSAENLKYPHIKIEWSDNKTINQEDRLTFKDAQDLFSQQDKINRSEGVIDRTSFSLFLDRENTYNITTEIGANAGNGVVECINQYLRDIEGEISGNESLEKLQQFMKDNYHINDALLNELYQQNEFNSALDLI